MKTLVVQCATGLLALVAGLAVIADRAAAEVWVVTDRAHPVEAPPGVRVIELDAASRLEGELAIQLPADAGHAAALLRQRMDRGGRELQRQLAAAYQGIIDAWSAGVTKVPAVIVDRRYIVYGERDVARAIREIERHRSVRQ